jgi:hypothetical protein
MSRAKKPPRGGDDSRYQFQPWPVKALRWLRYMPLAYVKATCGTIQWAWHGCQVTPEQFDWAPTKREMVRAIFECKRGQAQIDMGAYWTGEEVVAYFREKAKTARPAEKGA